MTTDTLTTSPTNTIRPSRAATWTARIAETLVVLFLAFDAGIKLLQRVQALVRAA